MIGARLLAPLHSPPPASTCPWQHFSLVLILPFEHFADLVMPYYRWGEMSFSSHRTVLSVWSHAVSIKTSPQPIWAPMKHSNGAIRAGRLVTHKGTLTCARTKVHIMIWMQRERKVI